MLLAGSDLLEGLHTVVLDEVHFLQDPYRGGVWEEVLVLSPPEIRFVCLSATVNNAQELGGWLRSVRGDTAVIVERQRPIVLRHHFAVHRREDAETLLFPLLEQRAARRGGAPHRPSHPPRAAGPAEPLASSGAWSQVALSTALAHGDGGGARPARHAAGDRLHLQPCRVRRRGAPGPPRRGTPDRRARACRHTGGGRAQGRAPGRRGPRGPRLRRVARRASSEAWRRITPDSSRCSGRRWRSASRPDCSRSSSPPKPSRLASTCRPGRWSSSASPSTAGPGRATLTSGEYLQLTGRAGRRGLDEEGHAVVAWSNEITFAEAARVASAPPPDLRSAFRPTYNLAVNLVARFDRDTASRGAAALVRPVAGAQARSLVAPARSSRGGARADGLSRGVGVDAEREACSRTSTTKRICWSPRRWGASCSPGPSPRCWQGSSPRWCSSRAGPAACRGHHHGPPAGQAARRSAAGPPGREADVGPRPAQRGHRRHGRADPGARRGPHGPAHAANPLRAWRPPWPPGHEGRPCRRRSGWPPGTSASWPRATSCGR